MIFIDCTLVLKWIRGKEWCRWRPAIIAAREGVSGRRCDGDDQVRRPGETPLRRKNPRLDPW